MIESLRIASVDPPGAICTGSVVTFTTCADEETSVGEDDGGQPPVPELIPPPLPRLQPAHKTPNKTTNANLCRPLKRAGSILGTAPRVSLAALASPWAKFCRPLCGLVECALQS